MFGSLLFSAKAFYQVQSYCRGGCVSRARSVCNWSTPATLGIGSRYTCLTLGTRCCSRVAVIFTHSLDFRYNLSAPWANERKPLWSPWTFSSFHHHISLLTANETKYWLAFIVLNDTINERATTGWSLLFIWLLGRQIDIYQLCNWL